MVKRDSNIDTDKIDLHFIIDAKKEKKHFETKSDNKVLGADNTTDLSTGVWENPITISDYCLHSRAIWIKSGDAKKVQSNFHAITNIWCEVVVNCEFEEIQSNTERS